MDTYHYVLYIHLLSLLVGIGAAAVLVVCLFQLRGARELTDALPWGRVAGKTGRVLAIVWNMTVKAGTGSAIAAAVIGYGVGAGLGLLFTRAPSPETQPAASPSGS